MPDIYRMPKKHSDLPDEFPWSDDTSVLSHTLSIGTKTAPNRFVYQPMEGCDGTSDGKPGELTRRRYLRFAEGGAGIIWFEATAVTATGRANPRQLAINKDNVSALSSLVAEIKEACLKQNGYSPLVICQLTHSGRYSKPYGKPEPLIAYNNPLFEGDNPIDKSHILTDGDLDRIGEALAGAASLAEKAGFDGADIKACHRYLLSELLSAYTREGRYGGCFENRTRLLTGSVAAARQVCRKDFIITTRFNAYDGFVYPYGFGVGDGESLTPDLTEAVKLVKILAELGVPMLNVTMGNPYVNSDVNRPSVKSGGCAPNDSVLRMLNGAGTVKHAVPDVAVVSSALSFLGQTAANVAAGGIASGMFDLAGFGRMTLAYPDIAADIIRHGQADPKKLCLTCGGCTRLMRAGSTPGCVVFDRPVYSELYKSLIR